MLQTIEAEIDVNGKVILLEPVRVTKRTRAIVTLLEDKEDEEKEERKGNSKSILEFLRKNRLPESARPTEEEIEEKITEARESWD